MGREGLSERPSKSCFGLIFLFAFTSTPLVPGKSTCYIAECVFSNGF